MREPFGQQGFYTESQNKFDVSGINFVNLNQNNAPNSLNGSHRLESNIQYSGETQIPYIRPVNPSQLREKVPLTNAFQNSGMPPVSNSHGNAFTLSNSLPFPQHSNPPPNFGALPLNSNVIAPPYHGYLKYETTTASSTFPSTSGFIDVRSSANSSENIRQQQFTSDVSQGQYNENTGSFSTASFQNIGGNFVSNPLNMNVSKMVVNAVVDNLGVTNKDINNISQFQRLFPSYVATFKTYFSVSHAYVAHRMLAATIPYVFLYKNSKKRKNNLNSMDNNGSISSQDSSNSSCVKFDFYIPLMAFVTYVLLFGVARGTANDFSPELLGATSTKAFTLLLLEVAALKLAFYLSSANSVAFLDIFACSSYKFVHIILIICSRILMDIATISGSQFIAQNNIENNINLETADGTLTGLNYAGAFNLMFQSLNSCNTFYSFIYAYLMICAAIEMLRNLLSLRKVISFSSTSDSHYIPANNSVLDYFVKYLIFFAAATQLPLCWLLIPSFSIKN